MLRWSIARLAEASRVGKRTINRFEMGQTTPMTANLDAIRQALEDAGVRFLPDTSDEGAGVRFRDPGQD